MRGLLSEDVITLINFATIFLARNVRISTKRILKFPGSMTSDDISSATCLLSEPNFLNFARFIPSKYNCKLRFDIQRCIFEQQESEIRQNAQFARFGSLTKFMHFLNARTS